MSKKKKSKGKAPKPVAKQVREQFVKNWDEACIVCHGVPTVGLTELCGPCCFGEADTVNGNW